MKLGSLLNLSFLNIKKEKARAIVTIFIIFVLSLFLDGLLVVGTSFYASINDTYGQLLNDGSIYLNCQAQGTISDETYGSIKKTLNECPYVSEVRTSFGKVTLFDYDYLESIGGISLSDYEGKNYVLLNEEYRDDYGIGNHYPTLFGDLEVKGFFSDDRFDAIADLNYFQYGTDESFYFLNIACHIEETEDINDFINSSFELEDDLDGYFYSVGSSELGNVSQVKKVSSLALISFVITTIILFFLSVGTISSSIIISLDSNYYLSGLYKALGMKDKDVLSLTAIQTFTESLSGVLLSSALIFILKGTVHDITENLFLFTTGLAISSDIKMIDFHFSFPFYIPMIMAVFFTVFSLLFAGRSILNIISKSPGAIMSEENCHE